MVAEKSKKDEKRKEKEAKKAEKLIAKQAKKEEKTAKRKAEIMKKSESYRYYVDRREKAEAFSRDYEEEIKSRGNDLNSWPAEVLEKYESVSSYIKSNEKVEIDHEDYEFDPSQGFRPVIEPEQELIKPFTFINNLNKSEKPKQDPMISDAEFMALELAFGKYLVDQKYRYECYNGIYKLFVERSGGVEEQYIIDNGTVLGGSRYSILANMDNDTLFIFADDPEIPEILKSKFYVVSDDCIKRNSKNLFESGIIYRYIDFSNTSWLYNDDVDRKILESKLLAAIQVASNNGEAPRMRFISFESANKFDLISDEYVKSPLSDINATSNLIVPNFKIRIDDNKITTYNNEIPTAHYSMTVSRS